MHPYLFRSGLNSLYSLVSFLFYHRLLWGHGFCKELFLPMSSWLPRQGFQQSCRRLSMRLRWLVGQILLTLVIEPFPNCFRVIVVGRVEFWYLHCDGGLDRQVSDPSHTFSMPVHYDTYSTSVHQEHPYGTVRKALYITPCTARKCTVRWAKSGFSEAEMATIRSSEFKIGLDWLARDRAQTGSARNKCNLQSRFPNFRA